MSLRDYIRDEVFDRRARSHSCLVVYDPARRYREIVLSMETKTRRVIDGAGSIIEAREAATDAIGELHTATQRDIVIWLPYAAPADAEAKQRDPFAVFGELGAVFPQGDGDEYSEICRRAKADHLAEINRLFQEGEPTFEMIDALDKGGSWPRLKTLLGASSAKEILLGVLSPRPAQEAALKGDPTWVAEMRDFSVRSLGHKLKTKGQTRPSIADELWRLLLFSEFAFDAAGEVPPALETVPRADAQARNLVFEVCEDLRRDDRHKDTYKSTALEVEAELGLAERTKGMTSTGVRDTFSCEERFFLRRAIEHACAGETEAARTVWESRRESIWLTEEIRMAEWTLAARAVDLIETARRLAVPKFPSLEAVVRGYASSWRELDRHHREMEHAAGLEFEENDALDQLVATARKAYFGSVEALQAEFVRLVEAAGWPVADGQILWNRQLFAKRVAPRLEAGRRVAYFLVDSLRYELGVEIEKQLSEKMKVVLEPVCAQLPTYTEIGMASLMPDAETALSLEKRDGKWVTTLGGTLATAPATRFSFLQSRKGDQCADIGLEDFLKRKKPKVPATVKLLVVRTRDIDNLGHETPHQTLNVIPGLVRQIIRGVRKAGDLGFDAAVIATDHGFLLFHDQEAGNVAPKPEGHWEVQKPRCLLGDGKGDKANVVLDTGDLGIPGELKKYASPRRLVPYARGNVYCHEGLSLQECVLPCISVELEGTAGARKAGKSVRIMLSYRQGKTDKITSRRPVIDLAWPETDLFADEIEREVAIEAVDAKERIVGLAGSGQSVNPATGCVVIRPGMATSVGLRMEDDFSGSFTVRVLEPSTNVQLAELKLKTAYLE